MVTVTSDKGAQWWAWLLAMAVHVMFALVLILGVAWPRHVTTPMEAELWSTKDMDATMTRVPPPQPANPPPPPKAEPAPRPTPVPPLLPKSELTPKSEDARDVDIALKKKQEKEEKARKQAEQHKREMEQEARQMKADALREQLADEAAQSARDEARRDQAARLALKAHAAQATLIDRYKQAIIRKIRNNTQVPDGVPDGVSLEVDLTVLPTGEVLMPVKIIKSSASPAYDRAVIQGIMRSQPLPLPDDPDLRREFRTTHLQLKHEK